MLRTTIWDAKRQQTLGIAGTLSLLRVCCALPRLESSHRARAVPLAFQAPHLHSILKFILKFHAKCSPLGSLWAQAHVNLCTATAADGQSRLLSAAAVRSYTERKTLAS